MDQGIAKGAFEGESTDDAISRMGVRTPRPMRDVGEHQEVEA
jgi:hypothetical protein